MAEYIEREALIERLKFKRDTDPTRKKYSGLESAIAQVNKQPAADVVEVVRCKDCKYYNEDNMSPHNGWCECLERAEYHYHYCNYADRKDSARMDGEE